MSKRKFPDTKKFNRREAEKEPRHEFWIFTEGKRTEPKYFDDLKAKIRFGLVNVNTVGKGAVPKTLVKHAISKKEELTGSASNSFDENFSVWVVFDRDDHQYIAEVFQICKSNGIRVAFSNPCFEVWALMHFKDQNAPIHRHKAQSELTKFMPTYNHRKKAALDFDLMYDKYTDARSRARVSLERRKEEATPNGNPSTNVFQLVDKILSKAKRVYK